MFGSVIKFFKQRFKFDKMYGSISNCTKFSRRPNNVEGGFQKYVINVHIQC